ncbi:hypothetical protein J437_LFUL019240, partial [Ladona fulva]
MPPRRTGAARPLEMRQTMALPEAVLPKRTQAAPLTTEDPTDDQMVWLLQFGILETGHMSELEHILVEIIEKAASSTNAKPRSTAPKRRKAISALPASDLQRLYRMDKRRGGMRPLAMGESYRHLGAPKGWRINETPTEVLRDLVKDLSAFNNTTLAPWQRLDAIRTFLLPRLDFHLRIADFPKSTLVETEKKLIEAARAGMFLPMRGSREVAFLPPHLGGAGFFPPTVLKDVVTVSHAYTMLTCRDPFIRDMAWYCLRDMVHRKVGRANPEPSNDTLTSFLTGSMENRLGADVGEAASLWSRARRATRSLKKYCGLSWEWNDTHHSLSLRLRHPTPASEVLVIPANQRHLVFHLIRSTIEEGWRRSLAAQPDQGKVHHAASRHPVSHHFLRDGRHTRFCDWRFIHRARLNLLPLNAARRGISRGDTRCRRCGMAAETLPH